MFITKFKKDPNDFTIGFPITAIKQMNGDYDGDELNFTLLLSEDMYNLFRALEVYYSVPTLDKVGISGNLSIFSGGNSILQKWLYKDKEEKPELDTIYDKL